MKKGEKMPEDIFETLKNDKISARVDEELFLNRSVTKEFKQENMEHAKIIYQKKRKDAKLNEAIDKIKLGGNAIKRLIAQEKY